MDIEKEIKEMLRNCDLVLVYHENFKVQILMRILKMFMPEINNNPLSPIFGYDGKVYGLNDDANLADLLYKKKFSNVCVINARVPGNKRRWKDLIELMHKAGVIKRLIKYTAVGTLGMIINMLLFAVLYKILQINDIVSLLLAIEISVIATFFMNDFWVFGGRKKRKSLLWRFRAYHVALFIGVLINTTTYWILSLIDVNYLIADFIGILIANAWTFYATNVRIFA